MSALFSKTSLFERLEGIKKSVPKSISKISSGDIIANSEDELVVRVLEDIKPHPPVLMLDEANKLPPEEIEVKIRDYGRTIKKRGVRLTIIIPFHGDAEFFDWRPSSFTTLFPDGEISANDLMFKFETTEDTVFDIKVAYQGKIADIQQYLSWVEEDITKFIQQLKEIIRKEVRARKKSLQMADGYIDALDLPLRTEQYKVAKQINRAKEKVIIADSEPKYDVFIAHASEDKNEFVRPLAYALRENNLKVWYDEFTLRLGDSLRRKIGEGLARSRYGIVVLSHDFFKKDWPQTELDGLFAREVQGKKIILPIWHKIEKDEVIEYFPTLAGKLAAKSDEGIDEVVRKILEAITNSEQGPDQSVTVPVFNAPEFDWTQSIQKYEGIVTKGIYLSISNIPFKKSEFASSQGFFNAVRDYKLDLGGGAGWPRVNRAPPCGGAEWSQNTIYLPCGPGYFWDIQRGGGFLFCTKNLFDTSLDSNGLHFNALLYQVVVDITFASYYYTNLGISGGGGKIEATLHRMKNKKIYYNFPPGDYDICAAEQAMVHLDFDFINSQENIISMAIKIIEELMIPFSQNGLPVIESQVIKKIIGDIIKGNSLERYYK